MWELPARKLLLSTKLLAFLLALLMVRLTDLVEVSVLSIWIVFIFFLLFVIVRLFVDSHHFSLVGLLPLDVGKFLEHLLAEVLVDELADELMVWLLLVVFNSIHDLDVILRIC